MVSLLIPQTIEDRATGRLEKAEHRAKTYQIEQSITSNLPQLLT